MFAETKPTRGIRLTPLRRLFLTGASLMVLTGSTLAADLPVAKAPPAVLPSWAGFYLGVHGGYGWNQNEFSQTDDFAFLTPQSINGIKSKGALYGAQAGYNWQFGRAVTGLEFDFSATDIKGNNSISETVASNGGATTATIALHEKVQYLGSARARLGWLPADNVLLYGTAGLAWERLDRTTEQTTDTVGGPGAGTRLSSTGTALDKFGWVAGVGAEAMLGSPNWIGRIEYLHYDLGQLQTASAFARTGFRSDISTAGSQTIEVVRAGVSYKFGEPAGVASVPYVKTPAATPLSTPLSTWAGFYIGAHGGYGWGHDPVSIPLAFFQISGGTLTGTNSKGWVAGGHFGHNWQYDRFVTGLEVDLSAADIKGNTNTGTEAFAGTTLSITLDEKVKYLGTFRGRLGWLPTDTVLLYGTAGLAWERFESGELQVDALAAGRTETSRSVTPSDRFGWVAGVGGEVMLGSTNWIGRLEYLHYDFGRVGSERVEGFVAPLASDFLASTAGRQTIDLVRVGASYKFGPDGPAVAAAHAIYAKAPHMPAPLQTWAGFYLGGHAGYGWKENDFSTSFFLDGFVGGIKSKGWLGGGQAGYNWQYASAVAGFEIDGSATGIKGSTGPATAEFLTETLSDNVKYLGTVRGRLGWTPASNWLLYATGGLAWERVHRTLLAVADFGGGNIDRTLNDTPRDHFGWVAGAGVESFIGSSNWIARLEYLHYDFGTVESVDTFVTNVPGNTSSIERGGRQTIDTVRAGLSYKFTP
jgi:outer membrane immunogenic protein